jgi:hypothetical protein
MGYCTGIRICGCGVGLDRRNLCGSALTERRRAKIQFKVDFRVKANLLSYFYLAQQTIKIHFDPQNSPRLDLGEF